MNDFAQPSPRVFELFIMWEMARDSGSDFDLAAHCSSAEERAQVERLIQFLCASDEKSAEVDQLIEFLCASDPKTPEAEQAAALVAAKRTAVSQSDLPPDTGRYRFMSFIARGGMGEVYRGEDLLLKRVVAIKVLRPKLGISHERFRAEAGLVAQLSHPGIVPVHDYGILSDGRPYFVMKLVEGQTLEEVLSEQDKLGDNPLSQRLQWFEQICQTVAYAHSRQPPLLHRDLKPQNVMIGEFGEVLVMD